jgi:CoA-transferase family III
MTGPLDGVVVAAEEWPAAREAAGLLGALGATTATRSASAGVAVEAPWHAVRAVPSAAAADWAESGAMWLTGRPDGPPLHATGRPATLARGAAFAVELLSARAGSPVRLDGARLLGERAALAGLRRQGGTSAGGSSRLLRAADGWLALSLARDADIELVPALVESAPAEDAWSQVASWAQGQAAEDAVARAVLLGLPVAALRPPLRTPVPWTITALPAARRSARDQPLVVNLAALWAGPLCAHVLSLAGARVIDVESARRPDRSRQGNPHFFGWLHAGHESVMLDFAEPAGRAGLLALLRAADVVIEASRPRALRSLGVDAEIVLADRQPRTWIRITGHGRVNRTAFGDDAAVAGGLAAWDAAGPVFAGDAIADPLTGLIAAVAALASMTAASSWIVDLSMRDVAARAVRAGPTSGAVTAAVPLPPPSAVKATGAL